VAWSLQAWPRKLAFGSLHVRSAGSHIQWLAALAVVLAACNPTRRMAEGERLLVRNSLVSDATDLTKDELSAIIKQKPNNKVLGQRLYLHLYNLSDPEKTAIRQAELDSACALKNEQKADKRTAKNEARAAKGKKPRLPKPKTCRKALRTWAREDVGEPPTILDSNVDATQCRPVETLHDQGRVLQCRRVRHRLLPASQMVL
jgi:hypothetical protein